MDVGKNIKIIRAGTGLKQKKLAKLLGVSPSYFSQVESGKRNPSFAFIKSFSEKLNVPLSLIFTEDYSKKEGLDPKFQKFMESLQALIFELQSIRYKEGKKRKIHAT